MNSKILKLTTILLVIYCLYSCEKGKEDVTLDKWSMFTKQDGLIDEHIYSLAVDNSDAIWMGTNKGVIKHDGSKFTSYSASIGNFQITAIAIDSYNNKWFGTFGGGLVQFDGTNWNYFQYAEHISNCIASNYIRSIAIDQSGNLWIGTDNNGVVMFNGDKWSNYTTSNGLIDNHVYAISIDTQGNKWFGTNGGISKFNNNSWTNYDTNDGVAGNGVVDIAIDDNIWLATGGGISTLNNEIWTNFTSETEWLNGGSPVLSIAIDEHDNKWFGTNGWGISKFDGALWTTVKQVDGEDIPPVNAIVVDNKGNIWFGTSKGLIKLEK